MLFDVTQYQFWIPIVAGVIIPFIVAVLTKMEAPATVKSIVAFICFALTALGTYLTDTGQTHTWKGALTAFVLAFFTAAGSRVTLTQQYVDRTAVATRTIGVGPAAPQQELPEAA